MSRFPVLSMGLAVSLLFGLVHQAAAASEPPYPPSSIITELNWSPTVVKMQGYANGDNWPIAWVHDDSQLTAFCDGRGFSQQDPGLSLGFALVYGDPPQFRAKNIRTDADTPVGWGPKGIKASDMIAVDDVLYMFVRNYTPPGSDDFTNSRLACSDDSGVTWTWADWHFSDTFGCPAFVQFGRNYQGARDEYVYVASQANDSAYGYSPDIVLARVNKGTVMERGRYTFFAGLTADGHPIWSADISERKPIFTDPSGTQRIAITYNAGLGRYILTSSHLTGKKVTHTAALGVFEAPEPWGPWSTVYYDDHWSVQDGKDCRTYHHRFPPKWISADGKTMWLLYSGLDCDLYSFCVKKATLEIARKSSASAGGSGRFVVMPVENPRCCGNELFRAFENYYSPRISELRTRYGLDEVVAGQTDEWKRILLLRHWIRSNIAIDNDNPTQTRGDTFAILDAALKGGKFHCTHFSIVQHAVLNSFGYVTRRLGCGPGLKGDGGHHGVNEVWVNKFSKWVLIDAKYDAHFEKRGLPLSALEIRDEVWRDGARSVTCVVGPDRRPMQPDSETGKLETRPDTYRWCSWETSTNRFTTFPARLTSTLVVFDDEIFRNNTWYRDGKPHWAYNTPYFVKTTRRDWIEWTPNVIDSKVTIRDDRAVMFLTSCTPNFRSFQIKGDDGKWRDCGEQVEIPLDIGARSRSVFRTISLFDVAGPEHRVEIAYQSNKSPGG